MSLLFNYIFLWRNNMNKRVALLLALCLVFSFALVNVAGAQNITLWTYPVGDWGNADSVQALIDKFNEVYPDIHVTVELLDYANGDDQVNTAIEGGQAPDLIFEGPERLVANWGAKGLMVDLADLWAADYAKEIYPAIESACHNTEGAYYEFPVCMTAHTMAINKDMFEAAGALQYINEETRTWTTEGFQNAVKALYEYGQDPVGAVYCAGQGGDQGTRALINNLYGGTFTNPEHTAYTADSEENVKALELLQSMDGINFDPSIAGGDEIQLFCNETLAMAFCWNSAQELNNADKIEFEVLPMAFPSDGEPKLQGGIWGFGVFDNGDEARIDAAKKFIAFITGENDVYAEAVVTSGFFPVREMSGVYDGTEKAAVMDEYSVFMPYMGDYYQVTSGWAQARTEWWNMLQRIGAGGNVADEVAVFVANANAAAGN